MLARMTMEPRFFDWNRKWGAPAGLEGQSLAPDAFGGVISAEAQKEISRLGMFSAQPNNTTRVFEYPWAYFHADLGAHMRLLEIGGALSGFQFVLSREGHEVDNVDPGQEVFGFKIASESVDALNAAFGTNVRVMICEIEKAALPASAYDRAFSLSVLEHLPQDVIRAAMQKVYEALKPGGLLILTVDLFLDLVPFTRKEQNQWGRNIPIPMLIDASRFEMVHGDQQELYGFEAFDPQAILRNVHEYFIGRHHPTLIQTLVLRRK